MRTKGTKRSKRLISCRALSVLTAASLMFTNIPANVIGSVTGNQVAALSEVSAATDYGLVDNIQDGTILHCFDWKYTDIKAELPNIAAAGFSSIQTSPAQRNDSVGAPWYMMYQPQNFAITTNPIGSKDELKALCEEADKYGINIIVDVVANHTRGMDGENGDIDSNLKRNDFFRYNNRNSSDMNEADWRNRFLVHNCNIGMRDLVSENTDLQKIVADYILELQSVGVDGIRWDAAKHIQLPSEKCSFWEKVTEQGLYHYGEILDGPCNGGTNNDSLMKEYTKYITVTDDVYGAKVLDEINNGRIPYSIGNYSERGVSKDKLIYWPESHDTYSNNGEYGSATQWIDQNKIDRAYALLAAQGKATALYFSRPFQTEKSQIKAGEKGSTHFTSKEVAAVNHFKNAVVGQKEYYVKDQTNNVGAVCRETGAVVVKGSGSGQVTIANGGGYVKPGTYKDEITGNTWTVTATTMTGEVGSTGIAVFYEEGEKKPSVSISKAGGSFNSETLSLTIGLKNATSGTYQIGNEAAQTFTGSTTITIGSGMAEGESVTVKLTATDGTNTATESYTFTKKKNVVDGSYDIYFTKPDSWGSNINCYAYVDENTNNGAWPGVAMENLGDGIYGYNLPDSWTNASVIFNDGNNQDPGKQQPGLACTNGKSVIYENGSFTEVEVSTKGTVTVKYVDEAGTEIAKSTSSQGTVGSAYTTTAATVAGYTLKETPANASGKYTTATITVTYVYTEDVDDETPKVTSSLASGSTFKTETQEITLKLSNAEKGTYSVDDGPVKSFTGSTKVVLGQGKIADSTVTVKATATAGTTTKDYTFTYNKEFTGTVNEESKMVPVASAGSLAKYYSTNGTGVGKQATITIDGSSSDWSDDMLIAQGAAWDVANHYKGGHENCVLDTYALYGAWDDKNLYVAWQMVNTTDTWASSGDGPLSDGGRVLDVPLILALSINPNSTSMSNKNTTGGSIWGKKMGVNFDVHVDRLLYMSGKPGLGEPTMYMAVDSKGNTDYKDGAVGFADGGIMYKMEEGNRSSAIWGLDSSSNPADVCDDSANWVDYKTFTGSTGTHNTSYDSFYEIKIPLATLGIDKDYIQNNGIGAMLVATRGESALDCIPFDLSMLDNATGDYSADPSTSAEKDDIDVITAPLAKIGNGTITPPPVDDLELNFGADRSSPQVASTALTLKAVGEGGTAPYTYEFKVNNETVATKSGSGEVSTSWTPSEGSYMIKCIVTDNNNETVTSAKQYTVESNGGGEDDCTHATTTVKNAKAATCTEKGYTGDTRCAKCDALIKSGTEIPVTDHKWGDGIVTKEPTETETGVKTYTCTGCTATKTDTIPMLNHTTHTWGEGVVTTEPTEDKEGVLTYTCTGCTATKTEVIPKKTHVHTWGEGVVTTEPTEDKEGVLTYTCTKCTATKTEVIPKKTHVHTWGEGIVTTEPTEDKEGVLTYTCTGCTATKSEAINKLSHTHTWDAGTVTKEPTETIVGEKTFKCTANGCTATKVEPMSTTSHEHNWVGKVTTEPTEDKEGVLTYTCTGCTATKTESIKKLDHVHSWGTGVITKQPTDTTLGVITYTCTECSLTKTEEVTKPKHEHSWGTGVITKQPTATEEGVLTYTCTECASTKTEPLAKADHAHTWGAAVITKQPTETEEGTKTYTCTGCTATKTESIAKLAHAHTWGTAVITKQPTATEKGVKTSTCTTCKATKTEEIPATGGDPTGGNPTVTIPGKGESFDDPSSNVTYRVTKDNATSKEVEFVIANAKTDKVVIPATVTVGNIVYKVTSISDDAFNNNKYIKSVVIGSNVKTIGESAFQNCKKLTSVTMGKNVTTIGAKAFYGCSALTSVKMSSKITKIGSQAFYKCTKLKSITIPSKVKSIGKKAFYGCKNLKKITIKTTKLNKNNVGSKAFKGINSKATIKVPKKKLSSYKKMLKAKGVSSKAKISK